jgi:two-component system chemotaxis sensor kinase CheA
MGIDFDSMLDSIAGAMAASDKAEEAASWLVRIRTHAGAMRNGSEPMLMLREVLELGGTCVECDVGHPPPRRARSRHRLSGLDVPHARHGRRRIGSRHLRFRRRRLRDRHWRRCHDAAVRLPAARPPRHPRGATPTPPATPHRPRPPRPRPPLRQPAAPPPPAAAAPAPAPAARHPAAGAARPPAPGQSIRIELSKLDKLIDAVGELVIAQAMMAQRLSTEGLAASEEIAVLDGLTRDIQESAMAIRAQPIGSVFSRVPRICANCRPARASMSASKSRAKAPNSTRP